MQLSGFRIGVCFQSSPNIHTLASMIIRSQHKPCTSGQNPESSKPIPHPKALCPKLYLNPKNMYNSGMLDSFQVILCYYESFKTSKIKILPAELQHLRKKACPPSTFDQHCLQQDLGAHHFGGFPTLGAPIFKVVIFQGLHWVPPIWGDYQATILK